MVTISTRIRSTFGIILLLIILFHNAKALIGACKSNDDCLHDGFCQHLDEEMDGYDAECVCTGDYTGPYCETPKVASAKNCLVDSDCQNGGTCGFDSTLNIGICNCPSDHYGYHCQERCPCFHGGTCKTDYLTGLYECQCTEEFYDRLCASRWDGEGGQGQITTNRAQSMLITLLAVTLGFFCCLVYLACSKGENDKGCKTGNPGLVRMANGNIVYSDEDTDPSNEAEEDPKEPDTEPDSLTDLELT